MNCIRCERELVEGEDELCLECILEVTEEMIES